LVFAEQGLQGWEKCVGNNLGAFDGGMDAILLNRPGDTDQVFVDHGHEGGMMLGGQIAKDLVEGLNVVRAIIRGERDTGEQDLDMRGLQSREDVIEIAASLVGGQTAESVITTEFDDYNFRVQKQDRADVGDCVLCGRPAGALIINLIVVSAGI